MVMGTLWLICAVMVDRGKSSKNAILAFRSVALKCMCMCMCMCMCVCVFLAGGAQHNVLINFSGAMCDSPPKPPQRSVCSFDSSLVSVNTSILPNKKHDFHGNLSSRQSPQPQPQLSTTCWLAFRGLYDSPPKPPQRVGELCGSNSVVQQIVATCHCHGNGDVVAHMRRHGG